MDCQIFEKQQVVIQCFMHDFHVSTSNFHMDCQILEISSFQSELYDSVFHVSMAKLKH